MASSTSLTKICAIPARRPGSSSHQSASHRLWARTPARRSSSSALDGGRAITAPVGKNGGTVFGELKYTEDQILPQRPSEYFARNCFAGVSFPSPTEAAGRHKI